MTELEKADVRIQEICDKIRTDTLDPAKEAATAIIEKAQKDADAIIENAKRKAEEIKEELKASLEEDRTVFQSTLQQSCRQALELLKLKVEDAFFNPKLVSWIEENLGDAKAHAKLVDVLVEAIHKEGVHADLIALVADKFSVDELNANIANEILKSLKNHTVQLTNIQAGVQVKLVDRKMVLDISEKALEDIVASLLRKDFREIFFQKS